MKIAMMGFDFCSANKGCEALTISFVNLLKETIGKEDSLKIYNYSYSEFSSFIEKYPEIEFIKKRPSLKSIKYWRQLKKEFDQMDYIVDVTFGDGFSDIYGKKWNIITNIMKTIACKSKTPFILLPQTYGPYKNPILKKWALWIINKSDKAYSRDTESSLEFNKKCSGKICPVTDLAFALPYSKDMYNYIGNSKSIGINVSSLLWDSVYASENRFNLKTDYKKYINILINELLKKNDIIIHLIAHVIDKDHYDAPENDVRSCEELKRDFYSNNDRVIVAPAFDSPIEAKSYISNMDVFVGARMHSTIGALSSGVATIPFAYSKKFKTLFGDLEYDYVIEARYLTTEKAIEKTISFVNREKELKEKVYNTKEIIDNKLEVIKKDIRSWMNQ